MKAIYIACLLFCCVNLQAQLITPGEQAGFVKSAAVLNYPKKELRLSDFRGRMLILDFWNHSCISCIRHFEKWEALQQQFGNKIQFVLVCKEGLDSTLRFFAKRKKIKMPSLPMITDGKETWFRFNEDQSPYQVWIDAKGILRNITEPSSLTPKNIRAFLDNQPVIIPNIQVSKTNIDNGSSTVSGLNTLYRSAILPYDPLSKEGLYENKLVNDGKSVHLFIPNSSVLKLYQVAWREYDKYDFSAPAQLVLDVKDSYPYSNPADVEAITEWKMKHTYSYELLIPVGKRAERYKLMQQDLQRFFGLTAGIEKRKIKVIALIRTTTANKLKTKGGLPKDELQLSSLRRPLQDSLREFINKPFGIFKEKISGWIRFHRQLPFFDRTGYAGSIDIIIREESMDPFNEKELRKDLQQYGLDLIEAEELLDVLVIKEESSL
jgi:thiol-disulfide isomerase/thioredoxin